ncbi:hypothetical protein LTR17_015718 [Elasticomyces elasticus]|nr:hypothetical protein LTR17_015718 [Elasticomyces elasticus]
MATMAGDNVESELLDRCHDAERLILKLNKEILTNHADLKAARDAAFAPGTALRNALDELAGANDHIDKLNRMIEDIKADQADKMEDMKAKYVAMKADQAAKIEDMKAKHAAKIASQKCLSQFFMTRYHTIANKKAFAMAAREFARTGIVPARVSEEELKRHLQKYGSEKEWEHCIQVLEGRPLTKEDRFQAAGERYDASRE